MAGLNPNYVRERLQEVSQQIAEGREAMRASMRALTDDSGAGHVLDHGFKCKEIKALVKKEDSGDESHLLSRLSSDLWIEIFEYLRPREIYSFIISSRYLCMSFELDSIMNRFILLNNRSDQLSFMGQLQFLSPEIRFPMRRIESKVIFTLRELKELQQRSTTPFTCTSLKLSSSKELLEAASHIPFLTQVDLTQSNLSPEKLGSLLKTAKDLEEINLSSNHTVSDQNMTTLDIQSLPKLKKVDLTHSFTGIVTVMFFAKVARNLKELNLLGCSILRDELVNLGLNLFPRLEYMNLSVLELRMDDIRAVYLAAPRLKTIGYSSERIVSNNLESSFFDMFAGLALRGHARAEFELARYYEYGLGVQVDLIEAIKKYEKFAKRGDVEAQLRLGLCYLRDDCPLQNSNIALEWLLKAASQGSVEALYQLGMIYRNGNGIPQDDQEAVKWFKMAEKKKHVGAILELGDCYFYGEGVREDRVLARWQYITAFVRADKDSKLRNIAAVKVGECHLYGAGGERDEHSAFFKFREAAQNGFARAQYLLGVCYLKGVCVVQNNAKAREWFEKAAQQNDRHAIMALQRMDESQGS